MDRRQVLGLGLGTLAAGLMPRAGAEPVNADGSIASDPREILELWPGTPPGGEGVHLTANILERSTDTAVYNDRRVDNIGVPLLTVFRPAKPNGAGIVIAPGGGYMRTVIDKEGFETARFLNAAGFTCFILRYRLPGEGWAMRESVALQDAQRAMRLVRYFARHYAVDPARLGVMGFSAGGHVAATLATKFSRRCYDTIDAADTIDAKPAYACLMYPVITMGQGTHQGSCDHLLGPNPSPDAVAEWSCERHATAETPPTFIAFAADDPGVPPMPNGMAMFEALMRAGVKTELHAFESGGHGFGIRLAQGHPCAAWPDLFLNWAKSNGFAGGAA